MKNTIILMTALLPTTGHADLIDFALQIPDNRVCVLISGRTFEPLGSLERHTALTKHFKNSGAEIHHSIINDAPQDPSQMPVGFWEWWKDEINKNFPNIHGLWDYVISSEEYGLRLSEELNAEFLPYDIGRTRNNTKSSEVRKDMWNKWEDILLESRTDFAVKATIFGQESVGKTTISAAVAKNLKIPWNAEYARPYLETVGSELSHNKMENIFRGQAALQKLSLKKLAKPVSIFDTDLFSTLGYYRILNLKISDEFLRIAKELKSEVYYVLPDDIPFIEDQLRYGGNVRETDTQFWVNLLKEFDLNCVLVPSGSVTEKEEWISRDLRFRFDKKCEKLKNFQRD